jgi:hypothetical protein
MPLAGLQVRLFLPHLAHSTVSCPVHITGHAGSWQFAVQITVEPSGHIMGSPGLQPGCLHAPSSFHLPVFMSHVRVRVPPHAHSTAASPVQGFGQSGNVHSAVHATFVPSEQVMLAPGSQPSCAHTPSSFHWPVMMLHERRRWPPHSQVTSATPAHIMGLGQSGHMQLLVQLTAEPIGHII